MSAPSSSGFWCRTVAKTLSTTTCAPAAWASSHTARTSTSSCMGLEGDSKNTASVGSLNASRHWSRSAPSTNTVSTPQRGSISLQITKQEPNSAREATRREPLPHSAASATNTADMPELVAKHASAPSICRSRSWNIATVGLP